jgi:phenylacetate-CoA ligase
MPILTREDVKKNFHQLIARNYKPSDLILGRTSGTTGSPLQFFYDKQICLIKNVFDWRQKRIAKVNPGEKMAFWGGRVIVPLSAKKPPFWRMNRIMNQMFFSSFHLSKDSFDAYLRKLRHFAPVAIEGYPSTMYLVASLLLDRGETLPLRAVFTSSETMLAQHRETIERAFQCRLFDFYGLAERTIFATECEEHSGHHINMDFGITEILDNNGFPVPAQKLGHIISTGLHNWGMPLIRYKLGDVTVIKDKACSCGRAFPLMDDITTKSEDIITTRDGRFISSSILTHPFKPLRGIAESQIVQEDRENIIVKIVKRPLYTQRDSLYLIEKLKERVGQDMNVEIEFVDIIPRTKAGKFRWVISKVPLDL